LVENERDIDMEVSTPGIQRNMRDVYEFEVFVGRRCRILDSNKELWYEGVIESVDEQSVTLGLAQIEDSKEIIGTHKIPYSQIQKAKLTYAWEDIS
jgi:ribosome maturation factor RimP